MHCTPAPTNGEMHIMTFLFFKEIISQLGSTLIYVYSVLIIEYTFYKKNSSVSSFAAGGLGSGVPCYVLASVSMIAMQIYVIRVMLHKAIIRISTFSSGVLGSDVLG